MPAPHSPTSSVRRWTIASLPPARLRSATITVGARTGPEGLVDVVVAGELDVADQYAVIDALTAYVLLGAQHLVLDVSGVAFADLAAMRAIDQVRRFLERDGGSLTVNGASRTVEVLWLLVR